MTNGLLKEEAARMSPLVKVTLTTGGLPPSKIRSYPQHSWIFLLHNLFLFQVSQTPDYSFLVAELTSVCVVFSRALSGSVVTTHPR